jgi:hypothetical protein
MITILGKEYTMDELMKLRELIEKAMNHLDDTDAVQGVTLYPNWEDLFEEQYEFTQDDVNKGFRCKYNDLLYKVRQPHMIQAEYTPDLTPALFAVVNEANEGSLEDPIPAVAGMQYVKDMYYIYNDVIYLCIRQDTEEGTVLHFTPDALVGQYFEVVE